MTNPVTGLITLSPKQLLSCPITPVCGDTSLRNLHSSSQTQHFVPPTWISTAKAISRFTSNCGRAAPSAHNQAAARYPRHREAAAWTQHPAAQEGSTRPGAGQRCAGHRETWGSPPQEGAAGSAPPPGSSSQTGNTESSPSRPGLPSMECD